MTKLQRKLSIVDMNVSEITEHNRSVKERVSKMQKNQRLETCKEKINAMEIEIDSLNETLKRNPDFPFQHVPNTNIYRKNNISFVFMSWAPDVHTEHKTSGES